MVTVPLKQRLLNEIDLYHDGYLNQEVKVKRNLKYLREQVKKSPKDSYVLYQLAYTLFLDKQYEEVRLVIIDPVEKILHQLLKPATGSSK